MTLVATEISRFGVVMVADTAETREVTALSGRAYPRTIFGTSKLYPVLLLDGGASFWGAGELLVEVPKGSGRLPTDVWLEDFIGVNQNLQTLEQFAYGLRRELNRLQSAEAPLLGFQVGGLENVNQVTQPVFYRISNFDFRGGRRPEFEVQPYPASPHLQDKPELFADGDTALFLELRQRISDDQNPLSTKRGVVPRSDLTGRGEYLAAWLRFTSDLYQSAGLMRTIGGSVTTLTMDPAMPAGKRCTLSSV